MIAEAMQAARQLRQINPLVLNLTNLVTMDFMANTLLALGAAPIMSMEIAELSELIALASSVNINIGTLDDDFAKLSLKAAKLCKKLSKPLVLDPVGAGASIARTKLARSILPFANIVRGNASEIMALADYKAKSKGVDSAHKSTEAKAAAQELASNYNLTVIVSGEIDLVVTRAKYIELEVGTPLMKLVTGMGCVLSAAVAAFRAVIADDFTASQLATYYYGYCGEKVATLTNRPGTFRQEFINVLYESTNI
jgi:hydroxyethylthiazole kinase